ncbi:hypothetical protein [Pyruvatibacter sp.]|uniref:hypothetical protein n=1 Tax=Pyruvatibacter sp. TaxID=1981328 RepID=UPI0032EF1B2A
MARCPACNKQIVFGGKRQNGHRYCNSRCAHKHEPAALNARELPPEIVAHELLQLYESECPTCGRPGPIDLHAAHFVWSFLIVSRRRSQQFLCCRRCGMKRKLYGMAATSLAGWWSLPLGVILTPIFIVQNIREMGRPAAGAPSARLETYVRNRLIESVDWAEFKKQEAIDEPGGWDAAEPV